MLVRRTTRGLVSFAAATCLSFALVSPVATANAAPRLPGPSVDRQLVEIPAQDAFREAVEPSECGSTLLDAYVGGLVADLTEEQFLFLVAHQDVLFAVPAYDALFFGTSGDPDYALDSHARQLENTFRDLKRFWSDVKSDDIQLIGMHGDVLLDADRIARTLTAMSAAGEIPPMTPEAIALEARTVADFMAAQGDFYAHPLWTLNAYAFTGEGDADPVIAALPDKIVMGDGVLEAYEAIGLGDVGPRVILAHEFAHHIQFELGIFDSGPADPAEATRRTELMADAMAAYYAVHKKGLALNKKRVVDALLSFYTVGDCGFDNPGHHGTPLQRQRAAEWGADLAAAAQPRSGVLPAKVVIQRFDAALPRIVAGR
jgi:hypothetical protein